MKKEQPLFMLDSSEKDGKAEIVMDYVLSWCLRCSEDNSCNNKPLFKQKCRFLLSKLLNKDLEKTRIKSVKVWKEWKQIDLCVEVILCDDSLQEENHAILIENKYYTGLHLSRDTDGEYKNQLIVYKKKFDDYYIRHCNFKSSNTHYNVISCIYRQDPKFVELFGNIGKGELDDFKIFSLNELIPDKDLTESDIYNEFMLADWH